MRPKKSIWKNILFILTGSGAVFFVYLSGINIREFSYKKVSPSPQEILDHAINSTEILETKSVRRESEEIILDSKVKNKSN